MTSPYPVASTPDTSVHKANKRVPTTLSPEFFVALVEEFIGAIAVALSGVGIGGVDPLFFLRSWGLSLEQQGAQSLAAAQNAQTSADTANTKNQTITDALINGGLGSSNTGNPPELLQTMMADIGSGLTAVTKTANTALTAQANLTDVLISALTGSHSSGNSPDLLQVVLNDFANLVSATALAGNEMLSSALTALSPNNPGTAANSAQIAALQASLVTGMAGINVTFTAGTSLSANYPGTTNPAWTAVTGYSLCTVQSGGFVQDQLPHIMVFTGNPEASATDHGLVTDKVKAQVTIADLSFAGTAGIFICGHGTTGLGQNVVLYLDHQAYGDTLAIGTFTGPNTGQTLRTSITSGALGRAFQVNDIIGIGYDNAGNFTMYLNGSAVGTAWNDSGSVITHGAGYRESGVITSSDGFQPFQCGPGFSKFIANDV